MMSIFFQNCLVLFGGVPIFLSRQRKITKLELLLKVCEEYFDNFDISYNAHFDNLALKNKKKNFIIVQKAQV